MARARTGFKRLLQSSCVAVEAEEDGDVNSAGDDAEPPIQLDFSEEELQAEEELRIEHDQT